MIESNPDYARGRHGSEPEVDLMNNTTAVYDKREREDSETSEECRNRACSRADVKRCLEVLESVKKRISIIASL